MYTDTLLFNCAFCKMYVTYVHGSALRDAAARPQRHRPDGRPLFVNRADYMKVVSRRPPPKRSPSLPMCWLFRMDCHMGSSETRQRIADVDRGMGGGGAQRAQRASRIVRRLLLSPPITSSAMGARVCCRVRRAAAYILALGIDRADVEILLAIPRLPWVLHTEGWAWWGGGLGLGGMLGSG